jgi:hypothetical protein
MAHHQLVDEYREGRLDRLAFLRRLRATGVSMAAALALAAVFAPASHATDVIGDGPGNSEGAAARMCEVALDVGQDHATAFDTLSNAAERLRGTDCLNVSDGVDPQHNEILVRT